MSAIVGIYQCNGRPVDADLLARMLGCLSARGPHAQGQWVSGSVGFGHRLLHTTPESRMEQQPLSDRQGQCRLVWDGRLDNRDELIRLFRDDDAPLRTETDPELMLHAFQKWDRACFTHLLGDFAVAIWDGQRRRLICARDPIGVKPFYYYWGGECFAFSSEVKALLEDSRVPRRPNDAMIADYLMMDFRDPEATVFDGIKQLRPGHILCLEDSRISLMRYWDVDPGKEIRYANEADYWDEYRDLFEKAVRCRLRSQGSVGMLLSGGIDSTSVAAVAESIRRKETTTPSLEAYSFLHAGFLHEEWAPIEALAGTYGTTIHVVYQERHGSPITRFETYLTCSETLHHDGFVTLPLLLEPAAERGIGVLLTGFGADELFRFGEIGFLRDLLAAGRISRLRSEIRFMGEAYQNDGRGTLTALLWSHLPPRLRWAAKMLCRRQVPRWIEPSFAKRVHLADRMAHIPPKTFPTHCQEDSYRAITGPSMALALNWMDSGCSAYSMECRHPYLDPRLVHFVLSIPSDVKIRAGYRKMFPQRALQGIAPYALRPSEGTDLWIPDMDPLVERERDAIRLRQDLFAPDSPVYRFVRRSEIERIRERYLAGEELYRNLLWQFGNLERWLREYFPLRHRVS